ncbi:MAG: cbb3-type cytochrome c oxidase subunit I [Candidatus Hydrothermarchaeales archaeon]
MMLSPQKNGISLNFFKVALLYFIATLILGVVMITGRAYAIFGPEGAKAAHVHAGLLGFVTLTIMGAMYQIVPTLTGTKLYGDRLVNKQFLLINLGILGLFLTQLFTIGESRKLLLTLFGTLILAASFLFAYIIFKTMAERKSKIEAVTIPFFKVAILYYLAGITMGLLMVISPKYFSGFLLAKTAHAHLGTLGFITMTIFGAEYQMFPMLSLQKLRSERWARINLWSFGIAVAGYWAGLMLLNASILTLFVVLLLASTYLFLANMVLTLKGAKWSSLDISIKYLTAGHVFLFLTTAIGAAMAVFYHLGLINWLKGAGLAGADLGIYQLIWTHAHLALIGFVTLTIMGSMYHLVPMLVWMEKYGPKMGKEKVPTIQELFSLPIARLVLWASVVGLVGILIGSMYGITSLLRGSAFVITGSGVLFCYAMYKIML